jgi:DNA polymerase-3 subunit delta
MPEPLNVLKEIKAGNYAPIYFLQGEEPFYIDLIADQIEANALDEAAKSFNQVVLYGKDVGMNDVLGHARRYPMMSDRQVVIVREAQEIGDFSKESGQKLLESYFQQVQPSTILVFCYKHKTLDGRKSITKLIEKHTVFVHSKKLYDNQLVPWINTYIQSRGFTISHKAANMLADYIGNNLERLTGEIDKMLINFKTPIEIDDRQVHQYVGISKEYNAFELQNALAIGNVAKANKIVLYFEANPRANPIIPIIALLYSFFSKLLVVHSNIGATDKDIAAKLKASPFYIKNCRAALPYYPMEKVLRNIHFLRLADLQSKGVYGTNMPDGQILKELVYKLMH